MDVDYINSPDPFIRAINNFQENVIYQAVDVYDDEQPEFDCFQSINTGDYYISDCWVCNRYGDIHPEYNCSPVPVHVDSLGKIVA